MTSATAVSSDEDADDTQHTGKYESATVKYDDVDDGSTKHVGGETGRGEPGEPRVEETDSSSQFSRSDEVAQPLPGADLVEHLH